MRRFAAVLCGLLVALLSTPPAYADASDNFLNEIVAGLKSAHVFVMPGTPGTDTSTSAQLQSALIQGDQVDLVMLASDKLITDPQGFVRQICVKLGTPDIVGVTIGNTAYTCSTALPSNVASDQMNRAESVSTSSQETLVTFTRNIHQWEADNPHKVVAPATHSGGFPWVIVLLIVAILAAVGGVVVRQLMFNQSPETVHFKKSPDKVKHYLEQLLELRKRIVDPELQQTLLTCCSDVEAYFTRYTSNIDDDASKYERSLERMVQVIKKYIDIQNNPRYYINSSQEMSKGKKSANGFATYVLKSCQNGSTAQLAEYNVNSDILDAEQYR